ncbi:MAG: discoidin domain-containing protein [Candidatus Hydrogenedentes bacterium]|nr:discoidin domain-containing protein [Candidatus Hydrogenedentota bacterium]
MRSGFGGTFAAFILCSVAFGQTSDPIPLDGDWAFRLDPESLGLSNGWQEQAFDETVWLPGSLDENGKGVPNTLAHRSYLSRDFEYVGAAWYQREVVVPEDWAGRPLEVFLERCHWETRLWVDGQSAGMRDSLCAPHVYAIDALAPGKHTLTLRVDNSVKYEVGLRAHSITEHTQTNWNGAVGRMELRALPHVAITAVHVYPNAAQRTAKVLVRIHNNLDRKVSCTLTASAWDAASQTRCAMAASADGAAELSLEFGPDAPLWDEHSPRLIDMNVQLRAKSRGTKIEDERRLRFGLRDLGRNGAQLTLNGRPYFVRGNLECCIFPLTGYPAMDTAAWRRMMETSREYGLNHIRFHSWCPPEAAFVAADEAGITLQVETPVWTDLGKFPDLDQYIHDEANRILEAYGNHPSFAMLAVGNEPSGPNKDAFLTNIVQQWQAKDPRRLYTTCSGWPELPISDFHVVHARNSTPYRLHGGPLGPSTAWDYRDVLADCPRPAIAHELGQWCAYPDYSEIPLYTGVLHPRNLEGFRDSLQRNGMLEQAGAFAWASGKLQELMYKADIEGMLRTPGSAGFQLLSLQDFPGQGSALVGFLDALWNSKGVVNPDEFRRFCSETVPLLRMDKRVWTTGETFSAQAEIAHYGAAPLDRAQPRWLMSTADGREVAAGCWAGRAVELGNGQPLGEISVALADVQAPAKVTVSVYLAGTPILNTWDIWVYPDASEEPSSGGVRIADAWSDEVERALRRGERVLLVPTQVAPMRLVKSAFEPIFWNTQWFPGQNRHLGILCDPLHPVYAEFPNDGYTDWQWWDLLNQSYVMRLDGLEPGSHPILQVIDDWNKNRRLGAMFEARVGSGHLLVCTLDILRDLEQRPAAAALRRSVLRYMASPDFNPDHGLDVAWLREALSPGSTAVAQVEADSAAPGFGPENAVDGNPDTIWHTPWEGEVPAFPHELRILYANELTISGLRCLPRQDVTNAFTREYAVYAAKDGRNWGAPIATGEFGPGHDMKEIHFPAPVKTRWLRFVAVSGHNDDPFVALAEVEAIAPSGG